MEKKENPKKLLEKMNQAIGEIESNEPSEALKTKWNGLRLLEGAEKRLGL